MVFKILTFCIFCDYICINNTTEVCFYTNIHKIVFNKAFLFASSRPEIRKARGQILVCVLSDDVILRNVRLLCVKYCCLAMNGNDTSAKTSKIQHAGFWFRTESPPMCILIIKRLIFKVKSVLRWVVSENFLNYFVMFPQQPLWLTSVCNSEKPCV